MNNKNKKFSSKTNKLHKSNSDKNSIPQHTTHSDLGAKSVQTKKAKDSNSTMTVVIITIVISLLGGIPGIITTYDWLFSKPKFIFSSDAELATFLPKDSSCSCERNVFVISGSIANPGKKTLHPQFFQLRYVWKGMDSTVFPMKIPDVLYVNTGNVHDSVRLSNRDFLGLNSLPPDSSQLGSIMFPIPINWEDFINTQDKKFFLICHDIYGKIYKSEFALDQFVTKPTKLDKFNFDLKRN